ncbi:MAG TPA: mechanosensitive ion channel family protein [candidate division Zixibacteria bacterium]|nr:mechanosensitive ion channel family protein [candidate division Zixibacteria bacterium]
MELQTFNLQEIWTRTVDWAVISGPKIILILVLSIIAYKVARTLTNRLLRRVASGGTPSEAQKRIDTLSAVFRYLLLISTFAVAAIMILQEFGIQIGPMLAAAGIVGVAVGFGAQHLVKDIISGFFIIFEDQIRVGDVVQIAGKGGLVESVSLRMIILRDLSGNVHYIPNGTIDVVTNMTKDFSMYVFDIGVAYRENVDEVIEVIKSVDEDLRKDSAFTNDILAPIEILGLDQFADSAVIIKARTKTKPIKQWAIGREFNRRLKIAFDAKNIEIPFPHVTLYMGEDKQHQSPPMNVNVVERKQS